LKGDVYVEEAKWASLADPKVTKAAIMKFQKPLVEMFRHLKPLYIKATINRKPVSKVFVNRGAVLNIMPLVTLKKLGKSTKDLISTKIKMTNFTGVVIGAIGVLVAEIIVGLKMMSSVFFVVDASHHILCCLAEIRYI